MFAQALAAPGSSRSRTATGTTTASPAPRARRRWWDAASSPTAMILFAPSAPSKSLCKPPTTNTCLSRLCCLTQKKYFVFGKKMRSSDTRDAPYLRHTLLTAFYFFVIHPLFFIIFFTRPQSAFSTKKSLSSRQPRRHRRDFFCAFIVELRDFLDPSASVFFFNLFRIMIYKQSCGILK
jgi:hypothetical protein